jgi:hypothetical protein
MTIIILLDLQTNPYLHFPVEGLFWEMFDFDALSTKDGAFCRQPNRSLLIFFKFYEARFDPHVM